MWEFFFEKFPLLKKEFPLSLNKKWELKWEFKVGIVDKYGLTRLKQKYVFIEKSTILNPIITELNHNKALMSTLL